MKHSDTERHCAGLDARHPLPLRANIGAPRVPAMDADLPPVVHAHDLTRDVHAIRHSFCSANNRAHWSRHPQQPDVPNAARPPADIRAHFFLLLRHTDVNDP
jgi:hypothetical protein